MVANKVANGIIDEYIIFNKSLAKEGIGSIWKDVLAGERNLELEGAYYAYKTEYYKCEIDRLTITERFDARDQRVIRATRKYKNVSKMLKILSKKQ